MPPAPPFPSYFPFSFPERISLLKLDDSPPAPSGPGPTDAASASSARPSSRGGLSWAGVGGLSSSLVSLDAGTPAASAPVTRPVTPRAASAALDALKKFDSGGGGMVPLAADGRPNTASVPIGLGLNLLRPLSSSRGHAPPPLHELHSGSDRGVCGSADNSERSFSYCRSAETSSCCARVYSFDASKRDLHHHERSLVVCC